MSPKSYDPAAAENDSLNTIYGDAELSAILSMKSESIAFSHGQGQKIVQTNASFMTDTPMAKAATLRPLTLITLVHLSLEEHEFEHFYMAKTSVIQLLVTNAKSGKKVVASMKSFLKLVSGCLLIVLEMMV